jgi:O-antigen ligase
MIGAVLIIAPLMGALVVIGGPIPAFITVLAPLLLLGLNRLQSRPDLSPLVILFTAVFVPFSLPTGRESRLVISLVLAMFLVGQWLFKTLIVEKRPQLQPSPLNRPLLGFVIIVLISLVWGMVFRDPLMHVGSGFIVVQSASALVMIMLPAVLLLENNYVHSLKPLKAMVTLMLIAGAIGVVGRYSLGTAGLNDGGLFSMWIISLSVGLALFNRQLPQRTRGLLLILAGAWVVWGFVLHITWLAGWLPGLLALAVLLFMRSKKLFLIALFCMVCLVTLRANYYLGKVFVAEDAESGQSRLAAWEHNWRITGKHLLFGTGPAGYAAYYMFYFPNEAMATHNNYLDIIAQTGILGLGLCLWFFFALVWLGYKLCRRLRGRGDFAEGAANAALAGTVGVIAAMAIGDWVFPFAYTQTIAGYDYAVYNWLFMGAILVLDRLYPSVKTCD